MKKTVFLAAFLMMLFCTCDPMYTQAPVLRPGLDLTYIVPEPGAAAPLVNNPGYTAGAVTWTDISTVDPVNPVDVENFIIGNRYKARLTLTASPNYSFSRLGEGVWAQGNMVPSTTNFYHTGAEIVEQSNNTGDTIDIEITFPSAKERSDDPEEEPEFCVVTAMNWDDTEICFELYNEYSGEWKVYDTETGVTPSSVVSASYIDVGDKHILTLKSTSPIPPKTWYLSLTEPDKLESIGRLALWGEPLADNAPMSLTKRFLITDREDTYGHPIPNAALPAGGHGAVSAVFSLLHAYIQDVKGNINEASDYAIPGIALGDWIDLESLTVEKFNPAAGYDDGGEISLSTNQQLAADRYALRLLVAGNNSFNTNRAKAIDAQYSLYSGPDEAYSPSAAARRNNNATPHLVFQFQNSPGTRSMDMRDSPAIYQLPSVSRGYYYTTMRGYLTPVTDTDPDIYTSGSGKYLDGLIAAGIPADVFFAPTRYVIAGDYTGDRSKVKEIQDKVWLPTIWELLWIDPSRSGGFYSNLETAANQARLEYYTDNETRKKVRVSGDNDYTWTASPVSGNGPGFCTLLGNNGSSVMGVDPNMQLQVCPAFCVK